MAAAVMRAMTFGALSGGSSDDSTRGRSSRGGGGDNSDDTGQGSRSSSKNRFSKSLSRESTIESGDEGFSSSLGLSKSLSRLSVSSGGNLPPGGGILINSSRSRPSSPQPPHSRSYDRGGGGDLTPLGAASTSQLDLSSNSSPPPTTSSHRPSLSISLSEPSTSIPPRRPSIPDRTHSSTSSININEPLTPS
ncbi:hypothetical protein JCM5353_003512, partial [Sporobolomyces roseus]